MTPSILSPVTQRVVAMAFATLLTVITFPGVFYNAGL